MLFDASYVEWLRLNHPDELPGDNDENSSNLDNNLVDFSFLYDRSDPYEPFESEPGGESGPVCGSSASGMPFSVSSTPIGTPPLFC